MVFSAIEQTGEVPFKTVLLTGIVRDSQGRKMSKSLDNGVDPLDVIDEFGADALRFFLVNGNSPGNDLRYYDSKVEASRNFANKLWNASRLVLMNVDDDFKFREISDIDLKAEDKWILNYLNITIDKINGFLDNYEIGLYSEEIYEFIWNEYCDWYLEMIKPRFYSDDKSIKNDAINIALYVLDKILKLLHPIMPFITEEIYGFLPTKDSDALIIADWPHFRDELEFSNEFKEIEFIKEAVRSIRNIRSELNVPNKKKTNTLFSTSDEDLKNAFLNNEVLFNILGFSESIKFTDKADINPDDYTALVVGKSEIFLPMSELVDREKELERLNKEVEKVLSEIKLAESKLSNKGFVDNAPEKLVEEEREKKKTYEIMLENLKEQISKLEK